MYIETERLMINELSYDDTDFLIVLLNQPSFIAFIGDKQVTDESSARQYIDDGPMKTYPTGIGMHCVRDKRDNRAIGLCGLMPRDFLVLPDIGYAFLEAEHGKGLAFEAASAVLEKVISDDKYQKIAAMTDLANHASVKLLKKLNFDEVNIDKTTNELKESRYFERAL